jgi:hypothetical protein
MNELTQERRYFHHTEKNLWVVKRWENELQELDRDELILEIIDCWKEQGLNGYKQIKN